MRREPSSAAAGGAKPWPRSTATANAQIPGILVIAFLLVGPFRTRPCVFPTPNAYLASSPAREARHPKFGPTGHHSVREFSASARTMHGLPTTCVHPRPVGQASAVTRSARIGHVEHSVRRIDN